MAQLPRSVIAAIRSGVFAKEHGHPAVPSHRTGPSGLRIKTTLFFASVLGPTWAPRNRGSDDSSSRFQSVPTSAVTVAFSSLVILRSH